eukprot:CAMPEP_0168315548 /NCGR_PEP_ID=MMETSP0210-20121227/11642_1 /TAXON_ID=40633 /ORGANISM="Condylostoma magnum, Strain COL2" /LENGTH=69 /DNA_ID=CAMNT_0008289397 /DNA_START=695 /DNA_END=904 /DNA_ORIENTATION=-
MVYDNLLESGADVNLTSLSPVMELVMNNLALNTDCELSIREVAMDFLENVTETKPSTLSQNAQMIQWMI